MDVEIEELSSQDSAKHKHNEETMTKDISHTVAGPTSISIDSDINKSLCSELPFHEDQNDGDAGIDNCDDLSDFYDDDDDDYMYDDYDDNCDCDYLSMQAQYDNLDLPAGVEAAVSWLNEPAPSSKAPSQISSCSLPAVSETSLPEQGSSSSAQVPASSSSLVSVKNSNGKEEETEEEVMNKYQSFKHFDMVDDFSDHHYTNLGFQGKQPPKAWSKKVQDEWKILENNLPDTIYVRVYEPRMDLLRAVIIGPQGTPYHDGLFVFDVLFPQNYPDVPPMVYYYSGGLRLNPNLYDCGKVCLSLLNTWTGNTTEKWIPQKSTMLQVLVSIQALILNARPFFNEPGYESSYPGPEGERRSKSYNEDVFILSLKTMMYTLRRPPKHFEDLVIGHFRSHAVDILSACKAYANGARVGSVVEGKVECANGTEDRSSQIFRNSLSGMMNVLVALFTKRGAKDCDQFRS